MYEQDNYDALFNPQVDMGEQNSKQTEEYQASADKGKNGVYQSFVSFPGGRTQNTALFKRSGYHG